MQFDKEALNKLLNLSDEEFKRKLGDAVKKSGIEDEKVDKVLNDVKGLKKTLGGLSEAELKRAATVLGSNKVEDVLKNLKEKL